MEQVIKMKNHEEFRGLSTIHDNPHTTRYHQATDRPKHAPVLRGITQRRNGNKNRQLDTGALRIPNGEEVHKVENGATARSKVSRVGVSCT